MQTAESCSSLLRGDPGPGDTLDGFVLRWTWALRDIFETSLLTSLYDTKKAEYCSLYSMFNILPDKIVKQKLRLVVEYTARCTTAFFSLIYSCSRSSCIAGLRSYMGTGAPTPQGTSRKNWHFLSFQPKIGKNWHKNAIKSKFWHFGMTPPPPHLNKK